MQREFEIFTKPSFAPKAVKHGFSWPGFFFIWIWAFSCGLWLEGSFILLADAVILFLKLTLLVNHPVLCALFSLVLQIIVGIRGNFWRSRKLESAGYSFEGLITASSGALALAASARGDKSKLATARFSVAFFSSPAWFQKIFAISWLTWKAALRFKLFLVIAALLILAVVGLPLIVKSDGTARGFTQIILTYTLSAITALLGLSTLWLSCGTLARDIEECQIQIVATKPIARWQIWLGKWIGIVSLNAALLAISGACVYGLLQWRATKLPAAEQKILREQVLVARGSAKEQNYDAEIDQITEQALQERLKENPQMANLSLAEKDEVSQQIREQVKADFQLVPPGYTREWDIDLGLEKDFLRNKPLQLRVKFNSAQKSPTGTFTLFWQVGAPGTTNYWQSEPMSLSPDTFHEFEIPANLFNAKGQLAIVVANPNNTALLFPLEDGMEVLYPEGGFALNFARGLGIIFCWMALVAALGLAAASFLSFPVATFFSLAMLLVVFSSGTLADAIESGSVAAGNEETGAAGHSVVDVVLIPLFKGILTIVNLVKNFSPIDSLSSGRAITWGELGMAFAQIVLLLGGIIALCGIILFSRRELATAQGNQ
jgi:hypothetical protein